MTSHAPPYQFTDQQNQITSNHAEWAHANFQHQAHYNYHHNGWHHDESTMQQLPLPAEQEIPEENERGHNQHSSRNFFERYGAPLRKR